MWAKSYIIYMVYFFNDLVYNLDSDLVKVKNCVICIL